MREIKFQGIYKPTKEKFIPHNINFNSKTVVGNFDEEIGDWCHFSLEPSGYGDVWLRQYTGLKDKNGRDIYEGDIVKVTNGAEEICGIDTGIGKVEWFTKWGFWNVLKIENGLGDLLFNGYVEVIGNIYEDPELLEAPHASK
ncbi:YopX family protein [Bacillus halotolerans]|uniref:YopX family protein n=1 Tax=Bacillus halotolerans TaxID=260554 RepID=UPI00384B84F5